MPPGQVVCSALRLSSLWTLDLVQPVLSLQGGPSGTSGVRLWDEKMENHGRQDRTEENLGAYILPAEEREEMASGLIRGGGPCWRREKSRVHMGKTCRSGLGKNAPQLAGGAEYSSPSPGPCPCMSPFPRQPLPLSPVSWYPEELTLELVRPGLNLPLISLGFRGDSGVKNLPANGRHVGSASGPGRSPGEGNGTPLQYSCLENPMDTGAWRA